MTIPSEIECRATETAEAIERRFEHITQALDTHCSRLQNLEKLVARSPDPGFVDFFKKGLDD